MKENIFNLVAHPLFLLSLGVVFALIANVLRDRRLEREQRGEGGDAAQDEEVLPRLAGEPVSSAGKSRLSD